MNNRLQLVFIVGLVMALSAGAEMLDRPSGIKIGDRMTLRPSVSTSLTYDSNVNPNNDEEKNGDMIWSISPTLSLAYDAETWSLLLSAFYNYRQNFESSHQYENRHNFGEDLRWNWSSDSGSGASKGWSLMLGESYQQTTMADDLTTDNGQRYGGDSRQFQLAGAIQRRFNQYWHADVNAGFNWLDYDQDENSSDSFFGWSRTQVGAEAGFAPSPWTDIILSGSYSYYNQDNAEGTYMYRDLDNSSQGFSLQAGLGSFMTERISYRLLAGWSRFEYAGGENTNNGFVYTASGNWKIGETWNTMLLASSYYQPSERLRASSSRVDAFSWGIAKSMVRGKLRAMLDLRYRHETNESTVDTGYDYDLDILTGRIGVNYLLCRYLSAYANAEYQKSLNDESENHGGAYDYDRWRLTVGLTLQY